MKNLTHRHPWGLLDLDDLLEHRLLKHPEGEGSLSQWVPSVDIKSEEDRYVIFVDVPGVKPEEIEIFMEGNMLTIKGKRETETKENEKGYSRVERVSGSFYRSFTMPDDAEAEKIDAHSEHGVLVVSIPKKKQTTSRRIDVKVK
ncbi:MAG: Hsp20/alpha crystallin family protein [Pseudomonadota bacterium]|nr:Hsp20/alpha crystallin family protein [Gammaproteobacteria bacterium]MBU1558994.1 Hsp20/alpha crystallin family protein [Gammaproteobacteria bacterium]MBU1927262.1 Hsp20/alpha crystallin family protein [Gammaproteobacteria bacterium]MBU2545793.1 Hsp20/alpha crystallin family protein [Gammaproteobacteria bacterium]